MLKVFIKIIVLLRQQLNLNLTCIFEEAINYVF